MKKLLIRSVLVVVVLVALVIVVVALNLNSGIKKAVETIGPRVTKVDVKLDSVNLSLLSGAGSFKGFILGNPAGYKTPHAISVGSASLAVAPGSLFSDKVVVKSIRVESPEINYEGDVLTDNLRTILKGMSGDSAGKPATTNAPPAETKPGKKLQIDEFVIKGAKVHVNLNTAGILKVSEPVVIPDIELTKLGQGPDGITAEELSRVVLDKVTEYVLKYAVNQAKEIGKEALNKGIEAGKEAGQKAVGEGVKQVTDGLGGLLNKKKPSSTN